MLNRNCHSLDVLKVTCLFCSIDRWPSGGAGQKHQAEARRKSAFAVLLPQTKYNASRNRKKVPNGLVKTILNMLCAHPLVMCWDFGSWDFTLRYVECECTFPVTPLREVAFFKRLKLSISKSISLLLQLFDAWGFALGPSKPIVESQQELRQWGVSTILIICCQGKENMNNHSSQNHDMSYLYSHDIQRNDTCCLSTATMTVAHIWSHPCKHSESESFRSFPQHSTTRKTHWKVPKFCPSRIEEHPHFFAAFSNDQHNQEGQREEITILQKLKLPQSFAGFSFYSCMATTSTKESTPQATWFVLEARSLV